MREGKRERFLLINLRTHVQRECIIIGRSTKRGIRIIIIDRRDEIRGTIEIDCFYLNAKIKLLSLRSEFMFRKHYVACICI